MIGNLLFRPLGGFFGVFVAGRSAPAISTASGEAVRDRGAEWRRRSATWPQVIGAAALRGTVMSGVRARLRPLAAKGFQHVTGFWPGEEEPPPAQRLAPKRVAPKPGRSQAPAMRLMERARPQDESELCRCSTPTRSQ